MKSPVSITSLAALGLAASALATSFSAQARGEVYVHIEQPGPRHGYVQPAPVYVHPRAAYVAPGYEYSQPDRHYRNQPGPYEHARRGPWGDHDGDGIANVHDRDSPFHQSRMARLYGPYGDLDGDGIMNHEDRDRDGDGVRNRHDRFPDDPYRY